jgi:Fur family ferric uptake transcriptional regulator
MSSGKRDPVPETAATRPAGTNPAGRGWPVGMRHGRIRGEGRTRTARQVDLAAFVEAGGSLSHAAARVGIWPRTEGWLVDAPVASAAGQPRRAHRYHANVARKATATLLPIGPRLSAAGERVTRQRLLIAQELAESGTQLSAQELYDRLRVKHPGIGRATVYRVLEALVHVGAARRLERPGHVYSYVACAPEHHHHLICTRCGRVEAIGETQVQELSDGIARRYKFKIEDSTLDFYGMCATCRGVSG